MCKSPKWVLTPHLLRSLQLPSLPTQLQGWLKMILITNTYTDTLGTNISHQTSLFESMIFLKSRLVGLLVSSLEGYYI